MADELSQKTCRFCGATILVAPYWPHDRISESTGWHVTMWDERKQYDRHYAWTCGPCMNEKYANGARISGDDGYMELHLP